MKRRARCTLAMALMFLATVSACAAEVQVALAPQTQTVKAGAKPSFVVTVTATASGQRVMKFGERTDLRDSYARLIVTKDGTPVDVPVLISDPGPTNANDYVSLSTGQTISFVHDGSPQLLSTLSPGRYSAVVKLWPDWRLPPVSSNSVALIVEQQ
jgi:hypothetical protein